MPRQRGGSPPPDGTTPPVPARASVRAPSASNRSLLEPPATSLIDESHSDGHSVCSQEDNGKRRWSALEGHHALSNCQRGEFIHKEDLSDKCRRFQHKLGGVRENLTCVTSL